MEAANCSETSGSLYRITWCQNTATLLKFRKGMRLMCQPSHLGYIPTLVRVTSPIVCSTKVSALAHWRSHHVQIDTCNNGGWDGDLAVLEGADTVKLVIPEACTLHYSDTLAVSTSTSIWVRLLVSIGYLQAVSINTSHIIDISLYGSILVFMIIIIIIQTIVNKILNRFNFYLKFSRRFNVKFYVICRIL
jgi:hypothetical protein